MRGSGDPQSQLWLTAALTDSDVSGALTLCFSLKKLLTTRKIGVIVSRNVGKDIKELLRHTFDFIFDLDEDRNPVELKEEDFVKVFTLSLKPFEKCVFLAPTMMVIKNCDEIFDDYDPTPGEFLSVEEEGMDIFVVQPSVHNFNSLMTGLLQMNGKEVEAHMRCWIQSKTEAAFLPTKYNCLITLENLTTKSTNPVDMQVSIVNLVGNPLDFEKDKLGLFAELVLRRWKLIQDENVQPLLESIKNMETLTSKIPFNEQPTTFKEPIAIVGMSCRYPNANNLEEFWRLLINGQDGTGTPPDYRWLRDLVTSRDYTNFQSTNSGFLQYRVEQFDAKFFGISPLEMEYLDPQTRLLHELVWEGLEDAAVNPQSLRGTNGGVFMGSWTNDYKDLLTTAGDDEFYRKYMGNSIGAAAARISFLLGLTGPSIATESGCSSAMVSVHLACKSLQLKETNFALACGVNLLVRPFNRDIMPFIIAKDGRCKTFDAKADGFTRAEGCGVLVLKRLSDAVRDGDKIYALVKGSGIAQEGLSKSMGTPTVHSETLAMEMALADARLEPEQVSYVETHGTGTVVGDPMEVAAIAKAYYSKERKEPLLIGSVKTNVGHTESCSGITGIMKVVLALQHEIIPPHRNFETLNPAIDLDAVPAKIPLQPLEWQRDEEKPRFAGVSSFGITGTDAHAIIQESPAFSNISKNGLKVSSSFERPFSIMKISAKTEEALEILLQNYKNHFASTSSDFQDMCYTANVGRADFNLRTVIISSSKKDAIRCIEEETFLKGEALPEDIGKICFLFTGQGSQYPGMGKQLYETSPTFRIHFEYCAKILQQSYNIDITEVLWTESKSTEISRTIYSQTSIFCVEYALLKLWESWGVKPDFVIGHSLGEFAAAVCAGILSVEDAITLVAERSLLIDKLSQGKMLVIKAAKEQVDTLLKGFVKNDQSKMLDFAAVNSIEQTVVAGNSEVILQFSEVCKQSNLKCVLLEATHAFHSRLMDPMLDDYRKIAKTVKRKSLTGNDCKYISGMTGLPTEAEEINAEYWVQHTREMVSFLDASKKVVELGGKIFIEVGPQPILSALTMMNNNVQLHCLPSLRKNQDEWETLLNTLAQLYVKGMDIDWNGFDQFFNRNKVSLPHYPFIGKKYWPDLQNNSSVSIHPLLGSVISNASPSKLFQIGLKLRDLEWIKDHAIGDHIIYPGTAYLDMCLAAGLATIESCINSLSLPTRPMKLENLVIEAPLSLQESTTTVLQTVAELNENDGDWNNISVKVYRKITSDLSERWQSHAKATFSPLITAEDKDFLSVYSKTSFMETLGKQPDDGNYITQVYDKLALVGLKFGPTFRSIESIWRDEENGRLLAKVKVPSESKCQNKFVMHPVILDAMIQALIMLRPLSTLKKSLYVPIKIGKFIHLAPSVDSNSELYIQAIESNSSGSFTILIDSLGNVLATMSGVELIDTTVKTVESVLEQQSSLIPDFWEEIWKPMPSLNHLSVNNEILASAGKFFTEEFHSDFHHKYNVPSNWLMDTSKNLETFVYLNCLRGLYEVGWMTPQPNTSFTEADLIDNFEIGAGHLHHYVGFICQVLHEEGILENEDKDHKKEWKVVKLAPSYPDVLKQLNSFEMKDDLVSRFAPTPLLSKVGNSMAGFLKGSLSPLSILFPEENKTKEYSSLAEFYTDYGDLAKITETMQVTEKILDHFVTSQEGAQFKKLRVLEIGAGTGAYTDHILGLWEARGIQLEYTYTDISSSFFPSAEKRFEKYLSSLKFQKLNIEQDPVCQGFTPEYFDIVYAAEVLHATKDIKETLNHIRMLMKPKAKLVIQETTRPNRVVTYIVGSLEGYWRFKDLELRKSHCTLEKDAWTKVLQDVGLPVEGIFSVFENRASCIVSLKFPIEIVDRYHVRTLNGNKIWLVFHEPSNKASTSLVEKIGNVPGRNAITIIEGAKFKIDLEDGSLTLRKEEYNDFLAMFAILSDKQVEVEGIIYCWALKKVEISSFQETVIKPYFHLTKSFLNWVTNLNLATAKTPRFVLLTREAIPLEENGLSCFYASTLWGYTRSMKNENFHLNIKCIEIADKLQDETRMEEIFYELWNPFKEPQIALRGHSRYLPKLTSLKSITTPLRLPQGTDRFQLILPETKSISDLLYGPLDSFKLDEENVEVEVKAIALNFRDVFNVIKPSELFKDWNSVGIDISGVVKRLGPNVTKFKVGDRVFGCNRNPTAMPSHITAHQDLLHPMLDNMSFCEAATIPVVYITSIMCLIDLVHTKKEDVVLLHTASGGVGLSALEICKSIGCTVIATAGSKRKRNYLRGLGIQHVFHSRNTRYADKILSVTNGRGVDVVLNSLTSEGFKEATLRACAIGANFIEMSKLNVWQPDEVKQLRPDVKYNIVDFDSASISVLKRALAWCGSLLEKGIVKPVPFVRFGALEIREALQYLQKAKQIGKVVCAMPEQRNVGGKIEVFTPMFDDNGTYLITGGLGGIGFEVCKWMIEKGAKHVILVGRSMPSSTIKNKINEMNKLEGVNIMAVQLDVGDFEECRNLFESFMVELNLPPLKGVMHAAGTLADCAIINQNWDTLSSTFKTKINGTINLHELTKTLELDHFVLFSSMASLFGSPGQCNHAAGNAFEDAFAHYRNSIGLPATTINWGQWGEVGIAREMDIPGLKPFSTLQGTSALEKVLKSHLLQTCIVNMESFQLFSKVWPQMTIYLDERIWKACVGSAGTNSLMKSSEFWKQYDSLTMKEEKVNLLKKQVNNILKKALKMDKTEEIPENNNLQDVGVDSLMFIEVKNDIQVFLGERVIVSTSAIKDCNSVTLLVSMLFRLIEGEDEIGLDDEEPTFEEVNKLIREDCFLPEHISAKEFQEIGAISEIKTVLLTGCTGNLGPYILKELTERPQISQVICLIRPRRNESLEEYLKNVIDENEIQIEWNKVRCVAGNVAESKLGMDPEVWENMCDQVDAIFHCAVSVDHTQHYRTGTQSDMRAVNIGGTKNVLEFACVKRLKYVYHASSLDTVFTMDDERLSERWPEEGEFDGITTFAYPITKYVCDMLMKQAVERGIPCKSFRFPLIVGESNSGRCSVKNNHFLLRYFFIMKNGIMPSLPVLLAMLPVDICADVSVNLFFKNNEGFSDIYNVSHGLADIDQEFVGVAAKLGYEVEIVENSEFKKRVQEAAKEGKSTLEAFKVFYDEETIMRMYQKAPIPWKWIEEGYDAKEVLASQKILGLIPSFYDNQRRTMDYVYKDLCFCKSNGWFKKYDF